MSADLLDLGDVIVTRLVGPARAADRTLWQITTPEAFVILTRDQARQVAAALASDVRRQS